MQPTTRRDYTNAMICVVPYHFFRAFFGFCPLTGISARGSQGRSDTALKLDSRLFALYSTWFPGICIISEGKTTKKSFLLCPPSLIQRQITTHPVMNRVDRNLVLYLPRLAVLVSIEADRPGAWFPGPLGPYQAWFLGIKLSRDFERVKVPVTSTESPFCFCFFWGVEFIKNCLRA